MRINVNVLLMALAAVLVAPAGAAPAAAQTAQPRVFIAADGLYQALFDPFTKRSTFDLFHESGSFTAIYEASPAPAVSGTLAVRVWRAISLGAGVTRMRSHGGVTIEGEVPHPFFFDRPRHVEGAVDAVEREEVGLHLQVRLVIPVTQRLDLAVFAGPSRWRIRQQRITSIDYASEYPFDEARLTGVTIERTDGQPWGYNAGIDMGIYLTNNLGVGALVMLATANPDAAATATTADTRVGGLRAGGGFRVRF